ncbi:MAG TPA: creatininase family protein [Clostridiales bacterium]|nr:creatininase family protein [Clostridiales bacterium]
MNLKDYNKQRQLFSDKENAKIDYSKYRLEMLKPREYFYIREKYPVFYLPLGTIEWHERHLPLGTDGIKAHELCCRIARRIGGIVSPPLYCGLDTNKVGASGTIRPGMDAAADFQLPGSIFRINERAFEDLLTDVIKEVFKENFKLVIICNGHNSRIQEHYIRKVANKFIQGDRIRVLAFSEYEEAKDDLDWAGDHAGQWETSVMMSLRMDLVDINELPPLDTPLVGANGIDPRINSSIALGDECVDLIIENVCKEIQDILRNL